MIMIFFSFFFSSLLFGQLGNIRYDGQQVKEPYIPSPPASLLNPGYYYYYNPCAKGVCYNPPANIGQWVALCTRVNPLTNNAKLIGKLLQPHKLGRIKARAIGMIQPKHNPHFTELSRAWTFM